jgi:hypothetical protein
MIFRKQPESEAEALARFNLEQDVRAAVTTITSAMKPTWRYRHESTYQLPGKLFVTVDTYAPGDAPVDQLIGIGTNAHTPRIRYSLVEVAEGEVVPHFSSLQDKRNHQLATRLINFATGLQQNS